jgi:hypothetical protein
MLLMGSTETPSEIKEGRWTIQGRDKQKKVGKVEKLWDNS